MDYFEQLITIVESRNMSEAAMKLNMAQPTLSTSMKSFENELGFKILEKSGRRNKLTPFGEEVYRRAKVIQQEMKFLNDLAKAESEKSKLLSVSNNFSVLAKDTLLDLYNNHKCEDMHLKVEDGAMNIIFDNVASSRSEIGIVRLFEDKKDMFKRHLSFYNLEYETLAEELICVVVGKNNPLYYIEGDVIGIEHLENCSFISHITESTDAMWMSSLRDIGVCKITMSLPNLGTVMAAVRKTNAVFIDTKKDHSHEDWYDDLRYITLSPEIKAELGMIKLKHRELSEIANEYVNLLKERIGIWNEYKAEKNSRSR